MSDVRAWISTLNANRTSKGARSISRQEAKEEVVERKGYEPHLLSPNILPTRHKLPLHPKELRRYFERVKDKAQHAVILDKATADKLNKDVQSYRLITVATLVDRLKINGSLARKALKELEEKGLIKKVVGHSKLSIYTRAVTASD
ncbi:hypothetical protein GP486_003908 [Trichoglossum hirsutum]|uniref:40S ribosomal protein S25 n=1 Tax=Trichoglossum hirsutum TaxID=265104 RepID=A0A9P8LC76_9PEZI|nr:hypothetical protein GP486_003908 [Trichoglossum hirsutum]